MTNSVFLIRTFKANHQHSLYQSVGFTRTGRSIDGDVWFHFTNFYKNFGIKKFFKTAKVTKENIEVSISKVKKGFDKKIRPMFLNGF